MIGIVEEGRSGAGLADLADGAAVVQVDGVGARLGHDVRRDPHHLGVVTEQLHRHRVLVRVHPEELAMRALVPVLEAEARHHLGHREAGPVALGLKAHEPVADPGERREHHAIGQLDAAQGPGCGERSHIKTLARASVCARSTRLGAGKKSPVRRLQRPRRPRPTRCY